MEWLNYHHLLYFWMVAKEGSITAASDELGLAHPTISGQIHRLEDVLGEKLFRREGRRLALTEIGRVAFRYADEIFSLGREFLDTIKGRATGRPLRTVVGVTDVIPKSVVHRLLEPAFRLEHEIHLVCREDRSIEGFLAELAVHSLDLVLADAPAGPGRPVKLFSHHLGECGTTFFAAAPLAARLRPRFPRSLEGARFVLPGAGSMLRRGLQQWFEAQDLRPRIVGDVDDSALLTVFGEMGVGAFATPAVVEREVRRRYRVQVIGCADGVQQRFYAISAERRLRHPAVVAIIEGAREDVFG